MTVSLDSIECRVRYARYLKQQLDSITGEMIDSEAERAHRVMSLIIEGLSEGYLEAAPIVTATAVVPSITLLDPMAETAQLEDTAQSAVDTPRRRCYSTLNQQKG